MTTKYIEETIVKKTAVYVSADGKEWEDKDACLQWEKGFECIVKASWDKIPKVEADLLQCGTPWSGDDHEAYILVPRSVDDLTTIINYADCYAKDKISLYDSDVGKTLIIDFGYDHDFCDVFRTDLLIERIVKYYNDKVAELSKDK